MSNVLRKSGGLYARKMAATAAMPAPATEMPNELADPLKGVIGEVVGKGLEILTCC